MNARDIIPILANNPKIQALTFVRYTPQPSGASRARALKGVAKLRELTRTSNDALKTIPAARLRKFAVQDVICPSDSAETIALSSEVTMSDGARRHLLLLDFAAPFMPATTFELLEMFTLLRWPGWLLRSGVSYHWFGAHPYTVVEWYEMMGRALLLPVAVDVRYMGHAIQRASGALRLFPCDAKPTDPTVLGAFEVDHV